MGTSLGSLMSVPDPATTDWVPLWSLGSLGALPSDTVTPAATRMITTKLLAGDTQPAWRIMGDGKQEWGPGGTTVVDTNLYRLAANTLRTNSDLYIDRAIVIDYNNVGNRLYFGSAVDVSVYRSAAGIITVNGGLVVTNVVRGNAGAGSVGANLLTEDGGTISFRWDGTSLRFRINGTDSQKVI